MKKYVKYVPIIIAFITIIIVFIIHNTNAGKPKNTEQNTVSKNVNFEIDKIVAYSDVIIRENEKNQRADWELGIDQFTDLAIYLKTAQDAKIEETDIKEISIENIHILEAPKLGEVVFYKRKLNDYSSRKLETIKDSIVNDGYIRYDVIENNKKIDFNELQYKKDMTLPIIIGYLNENVRREFIIHDLSTPLIFDSSILKRVNVPINALKSKMEFTIKIKNTLDQIYESKTVVDLPITEDIYNGNQTEVIRATSNFELK